ncbi:acetyltransferase [Brevibacillus sp. NPDC058079]|uniref:acetyltransferase n=1 Tax=Brevibacillus sp. NPDC058079 TaxID=3346330 RepID=UPI0036E686B2
MIKAILTSNISHRVIESSYTPRQLLDFFDEEELVQKMTKCYCQPIGETNVIECNCDEEWEDYTLKLEEMCYHNSQEVKMGEKST